MDRVFYGVHLELETVADELLRQQVANLPRSEKMDVLTPWKERDRLSREIYTTDGVPDPSVRSGMYHRAWNPKHGHLNSRDGATRGGRTDDLQCYVSRQGYEDWAGQVYEGPLGPVRPQSACRIIRWGRNIRLQCIPCSRYISWGHQSICSNCRTIYVNDEVLNV